MANLRRAWVQRNSLSPGRSLQGRELARPCPTAPDYELTDQFPNEAPQLAWVRPNRLKSSGLPQPRGWSRRFVGTEGQKRIKRRVLLIPLVEKSIFGSKTRTKCCRTNFHKDSENGGSHRVETTSYQGLPRDPNHPAYFASLRKESKKMSSQTGSDSRRLYSAQGHESANLNREMVSTVNPG